MRIQDAIGVHVDLLPNQLKHENSDGMAIFQDPLAWQRQSVGESERSKMESKKCKKRLADNIKEWTGLGFGDSLGTTKGGERWKCIVALSSVVPRRPSRIKDWDEFSFMRQRYWSRIFTFHSCHFFIWPRFWNVMAPFLASCILRNIDKVEESGNTGFFLRQNLNVVKFRIKL